MPYRARTHPPRCATRFTPLHNSIRVPFDSTPFPHTHQLYNTHTPPSEKRQRSRNLPRRRRLRLRSRPQRLRISPSISERHGATPGQFVESPTAHHARRDPGVVSLSAQRALPWYERSVGVAYRSSAHSRIRTVLSLVSIAPPNCRLLRLCRLLLSVRHWQKLLVDGRKVVCHHRVRSFPHITPSRLCSLGQLLFFYLAHLLLQAHFLGRPQSKDPTHYPGGFFIWRHRGRVRRDRLVVHEVEGHSVRL